MLIVFDSKKEAEDAAKAIVMFKRLVEKLRKIQHGGTRNYNPECPECFCMPFGNLDGRTHNAGCEIAALLKEAGQ